MRFATPVLLCQFGWLVLGGNADNVTEIDLLAPIANTTYRMSGDHRFPIVWALQNPQVWQSTLKLDWRLDNVTLSADLAGPLDVVATGSQTFSSNLANDAGAQFLTLDTLLPDNGTYRLTWEIVNPQAAGCEYTAIGRRVTFNTNSNSGAATDVQSALNLGCHNRSIIAYNFTSDKCRVLEDIVDDRDDQPAYIAPCSLGLDNTALAGIRHSLDTQYNKTCANPAGKFLCQQATKNVAYKLGAEAWWMGFLFMVFFL